MESSISDGGICSLSSQPVQLTPSTPIHCSPPTSPCIQQHSPQTPQSVNSSQTLLPSDSCATPLKSAIESSISLSSIASLNPSFNLIESNQTSQDHKSLNKQENNEMNEIEEGEQEDMEQDDEDDDGEDNSMESEDRLKKRRKQTKPNRVDELPTNKSAEFSLNGLQTNLTSGLVSEEQVFPSFAVQKSILNEQSSENQNEKSNLNHNNNEVDDDDDDEEGLICKYPNTLAGAATAVTKMLLASCGGSVLSNNSNCGQLKMNQEEECNESKRLNFVNYLAAAASIATLANSQSQASEQVLHKCEHCSCPFLSKDHKHLYEKLQQKDQIAQTQTNSTNNLLNELNTILSNAYEPGQVSNRLLPSEQSDPISFLKHLGKSYLFLMFLN